MATKKQDWHERISKPVYSKIKIEKDVYIPMRDGVRVAADIYRPDADGKFPALLAFSPFSKELQGLVLSFPPQARPNVLWDGCIEAGNPSYTVPRGYVHVIADSRGTGGSEGEYDSFGGIGKRSKIGRDGYDMVEWIAQQRWCDGNVGMIGISIFAMAQILTAAEQPPHLKAIFPSGGWYDVYRTHTHGGIFWLMARAAIDGRGGDSGFAWGNPQSAMMNDLSKEEFEECIQERLNDPDVKYYPNFYNMLKHPKQSPIFLDLLLNPCDGPFFWEGEGSTKFDKVKVPVYTGVNWGRPWFVDEAMNCYLGVKGPKKLLMSPLPPMVERPFHEHHEEIVRWYDYWLKGIDNGIMDEPPIKIFVEGIRQWRFEHEWPLERTKWTEFFLRPRNRISLEPEPLDTDAVPPDGFYQAPLRVTDTVSVIKYATSPLLEDLEMTGPCALYLHASIDTDDTNWMVKLLDVDASGKSIEITTGWLKASHRELNESKSKPWQPYHPHTRSVPVTPGEIYEYAIWMGHISNVFKKGHRMQLEIRSVEAPDDPHVALMAPDSFHLNNSRATTHKIYRDRSYPSRLLLPIIPVR
jgi:predicted acyl esterase